MISWLRNLLLIITDLISVGVHPIAKVLGRNRVRILSYHRVCDLPGTNDYVGRVAVSPKVFAQQMMFLRHNDFNVITLDEFVESRERNGKPQPKTVVITFDDGYRDNFVNAFPILEQHGFKATFFLVTDYIDSSRTFHWLKLENESLVHAQENQRLWSPLTSQDILSMSSQASFGSHTKSHCRLVDLGESTAMEELVSSKELLEGLISKPVTCFSYPYSDVNSYVKELVKVAGYRAAVTERSGTNTLSSDLYELRRTPVTRRDSPSRFKRKVEGGYDWSLSLAEALQTAKRLVHPRAGRSHGNADNLQKV